MKKGHTSSSHQIKTEKENTMKSQNTVRNTVIESKSGRFFQYAKGVALSAPGKFLLAAAVVISLLSVPLLTRAQESNEKRTLTGNWMVTVTPTPPPQAPVFLTLVTYFADGNLLQEGTNPNIRSTGRGNWERTGHQQFTQSFIFFRFDAARTYLGTRVVTSTITLSDDGSQYQAESVGQNFDTSGLLLTTSRTTEVAQRLF